MPLNYLNPNDWGKSPLTDNALRLQQLKAENAEESEFDEPVGVWRNGEYIPCSPTDEFRDTLAHTQLGANAEKLGGWDSAMIIANAIDRGDIKAARELIANYPESRELVERVITVSEKYRQR